jgi:hypothetical protein
MTTQHFKKSIGRSPSRLALLLIPLVLVYIGFLPKAEAVVPPPAGGYPNFTTAAGDHALQALTLGLGNTAIGTFSLFSVTTGSFNTAVGAGSLDLNTADSNTATGAAALLFNTTGTENTANGTAALEFNNIGAQNTANGAFALFNNTTGSNNTANGGNVLLSNTTGSNNTANGGGVLLSNTIGSNNTANGFDALISNTTGVGNTALGFVAGFNVTTASNVICIGELVAGANVSDTCFIGNIHGVQTQNGDAIPVLIDSAGQLGTMSSSARFKKEIKPMGSASEAILALKPVTFHYNSDKTNTPQFGLIAEEVSKVNRDLVVRDEKGEIYTVRYDAVNAMLLNEFLKEHRKMQELESTVGKQEASAAKQEATIAVQQKQIEALSAGLQKVSAQLATASPSLADLK